MLDLTYVRNNLERVRAALEARGLPSAPLDDFAALDAERRRVIAESDALNAQRNSSSREMPGALLMSFPDCARAQTGAKSRRNSSLDIQHFRWILLMAITAPSASSSNP